VTVAVVIGFCIVLVILAFLLPRLSTYFQRSGDKPLAAGQRAGAKAPGALGRWAQKPFGKSREAVRKSGAAGRRGRAKAPF
jgi:hypothetical protein